MSQHIRKGDLVMVLVGDAQERGTTGRVLRVMPRRNKVVVEGVNLRKKHIRPSQKYPQGGIIDREVPMDLSNVLPVVDGKPTRVRFEVKPNGSKIRVAVRTGAQIGEPLRKGRK